MCSHNWGQSSTFFHLEVICDRIVKLRSGQSSATDKVKINILEYGSVILLDGRMTSIQRNIVFAFFLNYRVWGTHKTNTQVVCKRPDLSQVHSWCSCMVTCMYIYSINNLL